MCDLRAMKLLFLVSILGLLSLSANGIASALTYKQDVGVNFTFNSSLSLTLSADDLHIYNLAPGSASDSNVINVKVLTNSVGGYTLNATVGNNTTYNTRNLIHSNNNISDNFASIDYSSSPTITTNTNLDTDKWAFSFSLDNGTNWSNYNGLPLYSDTTNVATLKTSTEPSINANGDDVKFKIAAKASDNKASGDYHNVINFNVVAAPAPVTLANAFEAAGKTQLYGYYQMQDMTSAICSAVEVEDDSLQLIDNRDNKVYWVAKLADGNCWMTQNLDHDIVTNTNFYTYNNTDIGHGTTTNTSATWTAARATTKASEVGYSILDWGGESMTTPASFDPDDLCWTGTIGPMNYNDIADYTTANCTNNHYHLGNYYNWVAAVASNDISGYFGTNNDDETDVNQSICPAGWMLPKEGAHYDGSGSFSYLIDQLQLSSGSSGNIHQVPVYFVYGGSFNGGLMYFASSGGYNSSVSYGKSSDGNVEDFSFDVDSVWHDGSFEYGRFVRCVAR